MGVNHSLGSAGSVARANHMAWVNLLEVLLQPAGGAVTPIRLATGFYDISWSGYTWLGSGFLLGFESPKESLSPESSGLKVRLSGVPQSLRSAALDAQYAYPGRPIRLYKAILSGTYSVVDTPDLVFAGFVDRMRLVDRADQTEGTCEIEITGETKYARMRTPQERRMSDEQQQQIYPGDTGLRHMVALREDTSIAFGTRA